MTLAELTGILSGLTATVVALGTLYATTVARRRATASNNAVSWEGLATKLQDERDRLRTELRTIDDGYKKKIRELDTDYTGQLVTARARISQLEREVETLYRRLYEATNPP